MRDISKTIKSLNDRSRRILQAVIESFIETGEAVGSRTLSKQPTFSISAATIRNVMADLENAGLLQQPHTSSGRIPTEDAYRLYVDTILKTENLKKMSQDKIQEHIKDSIDPFKATSNILADLTQMAGIVLVPNNQNEKIHKIEFVPIREKAILAIVVTDKGEVENRILEVNWKVSRSELEKLQNLLTEKLKGKTISDIKEFVTNELIKSKAKYDKLFSKALEISESMEKITTSENQLIVEGKTNFFYHQEFSKIQKIKDLFIALEEKHALLEVIQKLEFSQGIKIFFGSDCNSPEFANCSIVSANYKLEDNKVGILGVIGPNRMNYAQVIPIVDFTSKLLSKIKNDIES